MTGKTKPTGYGVHFIDSPAGQAQLAKRGLTTRTLATAIRAGSKWPRRSTSAP